MPEGFIKDDLQLKLIILYLMNRVIRPVTWTQILEMALYLDDGIDYFSLTDAVDHMVSTGQLTKEGDLYSITEKGRRNSAICETSLPYSVRMHADENLLQMNNDLRTEEQIRSEIEQLPDGTCNLHLVFGDGTARLLDLTLLVSSVREGADMSRRFKRNPSALYYAVLEQLVTREDEKP